jgi:Ser/Thr protein kinase RdoA (MazF antagonist)
MEKTGMYPYKKSPGGSIFPYYYKIPGDTENLLGWETEIRMFYEWCKDAEVKEQWLQMERQLAALTVNRDTFGFIHNNNHAYNLLWHAGAITVLDFDVANCHFLINDINVAIPKSN